MILLFVLAALSSIVRCEAPPIDQSPASLVNDIAAAVKQAVVPPDNSQVMGAILTDGLNEASAQAQAAQGESLLTRVVRTLVEARLNTHLYTGMCPRNYTVPCPSGYEVQIDPISNNPTSCVSSNMGEGMSPACASLNLLVSGSAAAKELFATKCSAQWPCAACTRNFSKCPLKWVSDESNLQLCTPPAVYVGLCGGETIDFSKIKSNIDKARWAASCGDQWPCDPE